MMGKLGLTFEDMQKIDKIVKAENTNIAFIRNMKTKLVEYRKFYRNEGCCEDEDINYLIERCDLLIISFENDNITNIDIDLR